MLSLLLALPPLPLPPPWSSPAPVGCFSWGPPSLLGAGKGWAPRGEGGVPHPARKNYQSRGEVAGQNKGHILK